MTMTDHGAGHDAKNYESIAKLTPFVEATFNVFHNSLSGCVELPIDFNNMMQRQQFSGELQKKKL